MGEEEQTLTTDEMASLADMRRRAYAFLASIYLKTPDKALVGRLQDGSLAAALGALETGEQDDVAAGLALARQYAAAARAAAPDQILTELAVDHTRLLKGISQTYGPPPPYESVYRQKDHSNRGQMELAVQRHYAEAGVTVPKDVHEQVDFIGVELDFMHFLCGKEMDAWQSGNEDDAAAWIVRQKSFLTDHITTWMPQFCDLMASQANTDFFRGAARVTKGFVLADAERAAAMVQ